MKVPNTPNVETTEGSWSILFFLLANSCVVVFAILNQDATKAPAINKHAPMVNVSILFKTFISNNISNY